MSFVRWVLGIALMSVLVSGCASSAGNDIVGNWSPSDGTAVKVITKDGQCRGMYYDRGKPLDIGGGMTCSFSEKKDSEGFHSMVVSQPPNQMTLKLKFADADTVEVHDSGGKKIVTMKRV